MGDGFKLGASGAAASDKLDISTGGGQATKAAAKKGGGMFDIGLFGKDDKVAKLDTTPKIIDKPKAGGDVFSDENQVSDKSESGLFQQINERYIKSAYPILFQAKPAD
jgi:hypothetical protein